MIADRATAWKVRPWRFQGRRQGKSTLRRPEREAEGRRRMSGKLHVLPTPKGGTDKVIEALASATKAAKDMEATSAIIVLLTREGVLALVPEDDIVTNLGALELAKMQMLGLVGEDEE